MHTLVKFTDYADSFINGCLYMNTLHYFWNNGFQEQKDIYEGIIGSITPEQAIGFDQDFLNVQGRDLQFQAVGYSYCNVFCMSIIDFIKPADFKNNSSIQAVYPPNMNEFGKYAVIIDDENEFLRRVNAASKNYNYLCGRVNYHTPLLNGKINPLKHSITLRTDESYNFLDYYHQAKKYDAFDKSSFYKLQNEWRICLYRGLKSTEHFCLEIGGIKDIAHVIETKDFIKHIPTLIKNPKIQKSVESYYGNTDRHKLRDMFYELGDNEAWGISTIG